jgi:beta-galactosidase
MQRIRERFEQQWRFFKGEAKNGHATACQDAKWRVLDLPHDWSIEEPFDQKDPSGSSGGYLPGGIGWYRKSFSLPEAYRGKRLSIEFDGVYMNATVWLNGHELGTHAYGYTSFQFDLTPHLRFGKGDKERNVLAVRVDNSKRPNTRWYSGSGIYRHVWLTVTDPIHVAHWGTAVSTVKTTKTAATIEIETTVENNTDASSEVAVITRVVAPDGKAAGSVESVKTIRASGSGMFIQRLTVKRPALWDVDSPALYKTVTSVKANGVEKDDVTTPFGIRTFRFDPDKGFILNGRTLKLKGVNLHHDNGCLGSVVYDRAEERRVELMKSIGANAIRTSHNPPSPEFIAACDRLGVVVMEEAFDEWEQGKLAHGYKDHFKACWRSDLTAMVMRDRNHPCIVLWSIGNEVPEQGKPRGAKVAGFMARHVRKLDPTRPVGYGAFPGAWTPQLWEAVDVCGYNYRDHLYAPDHKAFPKRCILGSETFSLFAFQTWTRAMDNKHIAGEFIWTGMDYIGESGIGYSTEAESKYPVNTACCGELDICGFKKTRSYYRDILWDNGTDLHIAVRRRMAEGEVFKMHPWGWPDAKSSWTWPAAQAKGDANASELQVDVYSACDEVELRLNGRTIGRNTTSRASRYMATWILPFEPGVLEAIGYRGGKRAVMQTLRTAGDPAKLSLTPDRTRIAADGCDLSFVTVEVLDAKGMLHPNADNDIRFKVKGPGRVVGIRNGFQGDLGPFQTLTHKAYNGRCQVVLKSERKGGKIVLTAESEGLAPARAIIVTGR